MDDVGGSTTRGCGGYCDGGSDVEKGVTLIKTRLLRKVKCIVFLNQRMYIDVFIYEAYVCGKSKV